LARREVVEKKTEELILPILAEHGFELYDVDFVKEGSSKYLRIYIDKPEGINVNDCELVSREFDPILDKEDYIDEAYIFEVSSPGLGRALKKDRHFEKSLGEEVEVRLFKALDGMKEYEGILKSFDDKTVTITEESGRDVVLERSGIALIRLVIDF